MCVVFKIKFHIIIINIYCIQDTCYTIHECFGVSGEAGDTNTSPQLQPIVIQTNTKLVLVIISHFCYLN